MGHKGQNTSHVGLALPGFRGVRRLIAPVIRSVHYLFQQGIRPRRARSGIKRVGRQFEIVEVDARDKVLLLYLGVAIGGERE